jgi:hypothetical protein
MIGFVGVLLLSAAGACCHQPAYRIALVSSLRPVDSARPLVIFSQVRGEACGRDAVAGAIRDLKRFRDVDGYVEVIVEETGEANERCARATAYPFRYGVDTSTPVLNAGGESTAPVQVPGRPLAPSVSGGAAAEGTGAPATTAVDCAASCEHAVGLLGLPSISRALERDRCTQRCKLGAAEFQRCISTATDAASAKACLEH